MKPGASSVIIRSHAKVNLTLDVLGIRPDGYHALESVVQTIALHDDITLSFGDPGIRVWCDAPGIPTDERNLVFKAAALLFERHGIDPGLDIAIRKRIPIEAGLGGGSSNGAAVIRALSSLLGLSLGQDEMIALAAEIGSDVPLFMVGGTVLVTGRGEVVEPLPDISEQQMAVVVPHFGISTSWAYRRFDEMPREERTARSGRMIECVQANGCPGLQELLGNDLEVPVIEQYPEIVDIKAGLLQMGASAALLCGSGSAVFGLFENPEKAQQAAGRLENERTQVIVTHTIGRAESIAA